MTTSTTIHDMGPGQAAIWFAQAADPGGTAFQCAELIEFDAEIDLELLADTIRDCLSTLEPFRCRFLRTTSGTLRAETDPQWEPASISIITGTLDADADIDEWASRTIAVPAMTRRDEISGTELTGHHLMQRANGRPLWLARFHHILADGYAIGALIRWIAACYTARATGGDAPQTPFSDHWATTHPGPGDDDLAFWRDPARVAAENPPTILPADGRGPVRPLRSHATIDHDARVALRALTRTMRVTELDALAAVTAHYTAAVTGSADITLGIPLMNRPMGSRSIDFVPAVNLLPLRLDTADLRARFVDTVTATGAALAELRSHGTLRGEELRRLLRISDPAHRMTGPTINLRPFTPTFRFNGVRGELTTLSVGPVADVELIFQSEDDGSMTLHSLAHGTPAQQQQLDAHTRRLALLVNQLAHVDPADITADDDAFSLGDLDLIDADERRILLEKFNGTTHPITLPDGDDPTLHALIHARRTADLTTRPTEPALWWNGQWITREEFWADVDGLAAVLHEHGAAPGTTIALQLTRSPALCTAIAATALTGAAWLPLDPALPEQRRRDMLATADPHLLITGRTTGTPTPELSPIIELDETVLRPAPAAPPQWDPAPAPHATARDTAYILFTSGSTGTPKGVAVPQEGILNRLAWMADYYGIGENDTLIQKTPASFDVSGWEFLLPLTHGPRLVVPAPDAHRDPGELLPVLRETGTTICHFVPSALDAFLRWHTGSIDLPALRAVITSGEALPARTASTCRERLGVEVHNLYGPTEASIDVTAHTVRPGETTIPIGAPVWNTRTHVLDPIGRLLPIGAPGRLFLAGVQVATGYVGRPDLSAERFTEDPFHPGERMYDSGDIAQWRDDGELLYLGRADNQVKLRGQRLEPGEIEEVLSAHPDIAASAVLVRPLPGSGEDALIAWIVPRDHSAPPDTDSVLEHARSRLPAYMIPSAVVTVDVLPMTTNGKLDIRALPDPPAVDSDADDDPAVGPLEESLLDAFREVLGIRPGARANFFDLGGTSLSAVRLAQVLRERTGLDLNVSDVFAAPSIRALSAHLTARGDHDSGSAGFRPLLALRPHRAGVPVFCFHPAGGIGWSYARLIPFLDSGRGVFAVQSPGLVPDGPPMVASIVAAAERAATDILALCAEQDITDVELVGWSVGGVLAQACAVRLADTGIRVRHLVLLDAYPAELWRGKPAPDDQERLRGVLVMAGQDPDDYGELDTATVVTALRAAPGAFSTLPDSVLSSVTTMIGHNARIMREHRTIPWSGTIDMFRAELNPEHMDEGTWRPFCGDLRVHRMQTTHPGMVSPEVFARVADLIQ
ncbi:amino acid adenylation domain-containing protein [Corynebacterium sp. CCM 9203]|uniref:amino acid adenylation domain-containing protein n=1 Tax=Corynebacterium sp. CCM 9203 TaxID=3057615 RepID=UPI0035250DDA